MEILQLRYFKDAAQTENFSKTSQKFQVPTSAVSQSIRRLEKELGAELFARTSNRISLNEEGKLLYQAVCRMSRTLEDTKRLFADRDGELTGEVRMLIACNRRVVSEAIRQFSREHPQVRFTLKHGQSQEEDFDLVISDDLRLKEHYSGEPLITEQIGVAFSGSHPLAGKEAVAVKDLAAEPFVTMHPGGRLHDLTQSLCLEAGFYPQIAIQCDDPYYIRKYIEIGLGVGFVPLFSWRGQLPEGVVCRPLEGVFRTTYAWWDPSRYMTKAVRCFLEKLQLLCEGER